MLHQNLSILQDKERMEREKKRVQEKMEREKKKDEVAQQKAADKLRQFHEREAKKAVERAEKEKKAEDRKRLQDEKRRCHSAFGTQPHHTCCKLQTQTACSAWLLHQPEIHGRLADICLRFSGVLSSTLLFLLLALLSLTHA